MHVSGCHRQEGERPDRPAEDHIGGKLKRFDARVIAVDERGLKIIRVLIKFIFLFLTPQTILSVHRGRCSHAFLYAQRKCAIKEASTLRLAGRSPC
jgi:hypothetical protein